MQVGCKAEKKRKNDVIAIAVDRERGWAWGDVAIQTSY
jgi:hypothetical protein